MDECMLEKEMRKHMTTRYTPIWKLSDFLLDVISEIDNPIIAGKVHHLHGTLGPHIERDIIETNDAKIIVDEVMRLLVESKKN